MGQLQTAKLIDRLAFPNTTFVTHGDVPETQCSESRIDGIAPFVTAAPPTLHDPGKFAGWALIGKFCTMLDKVVGAPQTRQIIDQTDNQIEFNAPPLGDVTDVDYYIHNGGSLILTRDTKSFAEFIHDAGFAYTIKGGKLYTNMPENLLQPACSILFDPLP